MKKVLLSLLLVVGTIPFANAQVGLNMPGYAQSFDKDEIQGSDLRCSTAVGSATKFETGVLNSSAPNTVTGTSDNQNAVYARVVIPIGATPRIDCSAIQSLLTRKLQLEVELLEREVNGSRDLTAAKSNPFKK